MSSPLRSKAADDDALAETVKRLRHAAFALAGAAGSIEPADRDMANHYLLEAARQYADAARKSGRT